MPAETWRKKPVEIQAMQLIDDLENHVAIAEWVTANGGRVVLSPADTYLTIRTLEGDMRADLGDWVIRGVQGEFYPCKPGIFEATYEPVDG
jgi:hypothetical protein